MSTRYPDTIAEAVEHELVVGRSRFIACVAPVSSVASAEGIIAEVRRRHADAHHNCTAMVTGLLGDQARSSDDGEPSGTAGVPMLEVLRRRELTDVVAVVTRYFGGVKLGAGGLIRAYSTAVAEALEATRPVHRRALTHMRVEVSHADAGRAENVVRDWAARHASTIGETRYGSRATLSVWVPDHARERLRADLAAASAGAWTAHEQEVRVVDVAE